MNRRLCPRGVRYKNRDEVRLWVPKRDVIQKLGRLTAMRNRLIKARKMLQSPLTDSDSFISKKDHNEEKQACQSTMDALKKDIKQVKIDIEKTIQGDPYLNGPPRLRTHRIGKKRWPCHCN